MPAIYEKRSNARYACGSDYYYSSTSAGSRISCILKNISPTGACIVSDAPLVIGENILLHVCGKTDTAFKATIVWKRSDSYGALLNIETAEDFDKISYVLNSFNNQS